MLIVSGRGQVLGLDEPERHLAGECWRDDWAVTVVSAVCPFSVRACWLDLLCSGGCTRGWGCDGHGWLRGCMLIVSGRGQVLVLDEPERHIAIRPLQSQRWMDPV